MRVSMMFLFLLLTGEALAGERTVTTKVQSRPGGPIEEFEMPVHEVPVNPPSLPVNEAALDDADKAFSLALATMNDSG